MFAVLGLEDQKVAGEYRRAVARCQDGLATGTEDPDQAAPMGNQRPLVVGSTICGTWSMTRLSWWRPGTECGAIEGLARQA